LRELLRSAQRVLTSLSRAFTLATVLIVNREELQKREHTSLLCARLDGSSYTLHTELQI
jgi:hypothetical protein